MAMLQSFSKKQVVFFITAILPACALITCWDCPGYGLDAVHAQEQVQDAGPPLPVVRQVAVFTFDNLTGDRKYDWLGTGFAEALTDKLRNLDRLILRNRREIADIARVAKIDQRKVKAGNAVEIGRLVGSDYLIFGAVQAAGDIKCPAAPLRATARLVETRTGRIFKAIQVDGTMAGIFDLQARLALGFADMMSIEVSLVDKNAIQQHGTDSLLAYKLYCEGLRLLDERRYVQAMRKFRLACSKHPGILYAEAHHALGTAFLRSGRKRQMLKEFRGDVARLSPIWFDLGVAYERAGKLQKAAEAFDTFVKYTDRRFSPWDYGGAREPELPAEFIDIGDKGARHPPLILAGADGFLHALDSPSGRLCWKKRFARPARPLTLSGGYAYFGTRAGEVFCVNTLTGQVRWQACVKSSICAPVCLLPAGKRAVVATAEGLVIGLDSRTGSEVWRRRLQAPANSLQRAGDYVVLSDSGSRVYAMKQVNGAIAWQRVAAGSIKGASGHKGMILLVTAADKLAALDVVSGKTCWTYERLQGRGPVAFDQDLTVVVRADNMVVALDGNGGESWHWQPGFKPAFIAFSGSRVAVAGVGGDLGILARNTGRVLQRRKFSVMIRSMTGSGSLLVVCTADGAVHALGLGAGAGEPDDREGYLHLAEVLTRKGDLMGAAQAYGLVLNRIDARCSQAMYGLAGIYAKQGRSDMAGAMYARIRQLRSAAAGHCRADGR